MRGLGGLGGLGGLAEMGGNEKDRPYRFLFSWGAAGDGGNEKDRPYRSHMRRIMNICIYMREKQEKYCIKMHKTD